MRPLNVHINEGYVPMVDGSLVYHRGFGDRATSKNDPAPSLVMSPQVFTAAGQVIPSRRYPLEGPVPSHGRPTPLGPDPAFERQYLAQRAYWSSFFPNRTLIAETGSVISILLHNNLSQPHEMRFHKASRTAADVTSGSLGPRQTKLLEFDAPSAGTYVFSDPGNEPVERTLGLFGALVVIDPQEPWRLTPGGVEFERQWLWMCHDIDPNWAFIASEGRTVDQRSTPAVPRYFTLNDHSGYQALGLTPDRLFNEHREEDTLPSGAPRETDVRNFSASPSAGSVRTGQMIRMINAGVTDHQLHFHGNHVWTVRANGMDFPRANGGVSSDGFVVLQQWEDTVQLLPLERKEAMLPLRRPPEVVDDVWEARDKDWKYPMHCHAEPSQTAAGGLYPGGLMADWVLAHHSPESDGSSPVEHEAHHTFRSQVDFSSEQPAAGSPDTEFLLPPDVSIDLEFFNRKMQFPDGSSHEVWCFKNDTSDRQFPGPLIRLTEGDIFHALFKPSKSVHTLHWHGIEPDPLNDGAGHTSFEVTGHYTYQWRSEEGERGDPNRGSAGTYFYHCHVNTPLHVQMGMFGAIIIDPVVDPETPAGARRHSLEGPLYDTATETLIAPFSIDPRWHALTHAAGQSGEDVGLNRFEPKHFVLLGGVVAERPSGDRVWAASSMKANVAGNGVYPTLVRYVNADYFPTRTRFLDRNGKPAKIAELIAHDGRPFWNTSDPTGPAVQPSVAGQPLLTSMIKSGAAEKFDYLLRPPSPGQYTIAVDFLHWITGKVLATEKVAVTAH